MPRRMLSTGVLIRPGPTDAQRVNAALSGQPLTANMPTDAEVRDALARITRDLEEMRLARTDGGTTGWTVEPFDSNDAFCIVTTGEGAVILRGTIFITRAD